MSIAFCFSLDADSYEKQPLCERALVEPVRLTPAWEETNLPNDELNFKDVTMEQAVLEMNPPTDWYVLQKYKRVQVLGASLADFVLLLLLLLLYYPSHHL